MKTQQNLSKAAGLIMMKTALILLLTFSFSTFVLAQSGIVKIDTRLYAGNDIADANVVVFDPSFSNAVGVEDAYKLSTSGENIAILRGAALLVVEGRQPATINDIIPFKIWNLRQQNYRLEIIASLFATQLVMPVLEDSYLHTTTIISRDASTSVNFTVTNDPASSAPNRFRIVFSAAAPLPVNFISIKACRNIAGINIAWKVGGQVNVKNYEIERSANGREFVTAGMVAAVNTMAGGMNYTFTDNYSAAAGCFYRIKSVDDDGSTKFSSIIKVDAERDVKGYTVLSSLSITNTVSIRFINQPAGVYNISLFNGEGKRVMSRVVEHAAGTANESVSVPGTVSSAVYFLQITSPANEKESKMIMIGNR